MQYLSKFLFVATFVKRGPVEQNDSNLCSRESDCQPFPKQALVFTCLLYRSFENLWEKEKLLASSNFSFFHRVFNPFGELTDMFIKLKIVVCKLSVWKSLEFVIWERVNSLPNDKILG